MHDSGKRQKFESGAVRDSADGKPRPDLQSPYAQERIGHWLRLGSEKYAERNWEQGMNFSRCIASLERHLVAFKMGKTDEDHLAAIAVNAQFLMHFEEMIKLGLLPDSLDDMPGYESYQLVEMTAEVVEEAWEVPQFKAGDKVKIKFLESKYIASAIKRRCKKAGNVAEYVKKFRGNEHLVKIAGYPFMVYDDELTLIEGD